MLRRKRKREKEKGILALLFSLRSFPLSSRSRSSSMNLLTQLASDFLINKTTLIQLLRTFDFSEEFLEEFRRDRIAIDEEFIRRKIRLLVDEETFFQDLFCHEDGIHLVFYAHLYLPRFIRFRLSFDVKIIALIFNPQHQIVQLTITNIQMKSFNRLLKPFRSCIQVKTERRRRIFIGGLAEAFFSPGREEFSRIAI